jgi:hypothetical protein
MDPVAAQRSQQAPLSTSFRPAPNMEAARALHQQPPAIAPASRRPAAFEPRTATVAPASQSPTSQFRVQAPRSVRAFPSTVEEDFDVPAYQRRGSI